MEAGRREVSKKLRNQKQGNTSRRICIFSLGLADRKGWDQLLERTLKWRAIVSMSKCFVTLFICWLLSCLQTSENSELAFPAHHAKSQVSYIYIALTTSQASFKHSTLWGKQESFFYIHEIVSLGRLRMKTKTSDGVTGLCLHSQLICTFLRKPAVPTA